MWALQCLVRRLHEPAGVCPSVRPQLSVLSSRCLNLQQQNLRAPALPQAATPTLRPGLSMSRCPARDLAPVPALRVPDGVRGWPPHVVMNTPVMSRDPSPAWRRRSLSKILLQAPLFQEGGALESRVPKVEARTLISLAPVSGWNYTLNLSKGFPLRFWEAWHQAPRKPRGWPAWSPPSCALPCPLPLCVCPALPPRRKSDQTDRKGAATRELRAS